MQIALVHDYLTEFGGGERTLQAISEIFPNAPIYTLVYKQEIIDKFFPNKRIISSFLQKFPLVKNYHRFFLSLMPYAIETFDFSQYDLVISDTASYAKGIITNPKTYHLCYCYTPTRYFWDDSQKYFKDFNLNPVFKKFANLLLPYLRIWDFYAGQRPDKIIAISKFVNKRIKKFYNRDSEVIYPPVETERFSIYQKNLQQNDYFLIVGRLITYKHFEIAIETFKNSDEKLKIIGTGPEENKLKKLAANNKNIEFLGWIEDDKLPEYYAKAKALIFPQEEDFGISAVEAMALGKPVIAYRNGGALESVIENETGLFFDKQTPESLLKTLQKFKTNNFNSEKIKEHAKKFDKKIFQNKLLELISEITK